MTNVLPLVMLLAQAASPAPEVDFGKIGTLAVPTGCRHVKGRGVDSAVGHLECGEGHSRIDYDIGFASPGAQPEFRGWCTGSGGSEVSEREPLRVMEFHVADKRRLFVCELPPFLDDPSRLVAVPSPNVSSTSPRKRRRTPPGC